MFSAVIFDLDGTLQDSYQLILSSMQHAIGTVLGKSLPDAELMRYVGTPLDWQMVVFADGNEELGAELARVYRAHNEAAHDGLVTPYPGVARTLQALRDAGIPMAVVTGKRHRLAQRGLDVCGLGSFMEFVIGPDDFPAHKPDPGPILEACRRLGARPQSCAYVGDSPFDMHAAVGAGCSAIACTWGFFPKETLLAEGPTYVIDTPVQLLELL